jgi:hypothetical protein
MAPQGAQEFESLTFCHKYSARNSVDRVTGFYPVWRGFKSLRADQLTMNYQKIYDNLITRAKVRELEPMRYYELHHIVPKCLGGTDDKGNLVYLTGREHFIAHLCLVKIYPGNSGLALAASLMTVSSSNQNRSKNRHYDWLRQLHQQAMREFQSGSNNSQYGTVWIHSRASREVKRIHLTDLDHYVANGWNKGRVFDFDKHVKTCVVCSTEFYSPIRKTCSSVCESTLRHTGRAYDGREQEFLELYSKLGSMNKALKAMGFKGAVGDYYDWAKKLI